MLTPFIEPFTSMGGSACYVAHEKLDRHDSTPTHCCLHNLSQTTSLRNYSASKALHKHTSMQRGTQGMLPSKRI
jgi:hypothetical protein